jgi:hypothetical protein
LHLVSEYSKIVTLRNLTKGVKQGRCRLNEEMYLTRCALIENKTFHLSTDTLLLLSGSILLLFDFSFHNCYFKQVNDRVILEKGFSGLEGAVGPIFPVYI